MDRGKRVTVIGALWVAADAKPAAGPVELETITVTATKTEHPAFEVAGSVSVVAAETIEAEQPQSLDDILKALPNIERRTFHRLSLRRPQKPLGADRGDRLSLVHKNLVS
jgi:outer membrane receptor for ferrienterochelin and colicin